MIYFHIQQFFELQSAGKVDKSENDTQDQNAATTARKESDGGMHLRCFHIAFLSYPTYCRYHFMIDYHDMLCFPTMFELALSILTKPNTNW